MKTALFITILILFFFPSCSSTYYLSSLSTSSEEVKQIKNGDFLIENDSLWVAHSFNRRGTSIQITIFNKSRSPLFVNWEESLLILNNRKFNYSRSNIDKHGVSAINPSHFDSVGKLIKVESELPMPKHISYVPPQTMVSLSAFELAQINFEVIPKKGYKTTSVTLRKKRRLDAKIIEYAPDNSPMKLQSNMTVYDMNDKATHLNHEFYLQNIIKSKALKPKTLPDELAMRGDLLYLERPSNNKMLKILTKGTVMMGVMFAGIVLDQAARTEEFDGSFSQTALDIIFPE